MKNNKILTSVYCGDIYEIRRILRLLKSFHISYNLTDSGKEIIVGEDIRGLVKKTDSIVYAHGCSSKYSRNFPQDKIFTRDRNR
jgi:hypothetical protein